MGVVIWFCGWAICLKYNLNDLSIGAFFRPYILFYIYQNDYFIPTFVVILMLVDKPYFS